MMKKVFKLFVVMSLLVASTSVFAQNTGKPEYPHYGFWSNWSIGGALTLNNQAVMGPIALARFHQHGYRRLCPAETEPRL